MSERFFISRPITADRITLDGPEAHHLLHVMRAAAGDTVTLFDDTGAEFDAVVEALHRSNADLRIKGRRQIDRELPFPLAVGVALPKGDRQKWLVEKLTELGVTTFVPLVTERSIAQPAASALERLQRSVIEAAKQCGRNRLMKIAAAQAWEKWIEDEFGVWDVECGLNKTSDDIAVHTPHSAIQFPRRLLAHTAGQPLATCHLTLPQPTQLAIGPEGGLTEAEVAAAVAAGWHCVSLGPRTLRIETAAVALAAAITLWLPLPASAPAPESP